MMENGDSAHLTAGGTGAFGAMRLASRSGRSDGREPTSTRTLAERATDEAIEPVGDNTIDEDGFRMRRVYREGSTNPVLTERLTANPHDAGVTLRDGRDVADVVKGGR
jgi:hypothetical protein